MDTYGIIPEVFGWIDDDVNDRGEDYSVKVGFYARQHSVAVSLHVDRAGLDSMEISPPKIY